MSWRHVDSPRCIPAFLWPVIPSLAFSSPFFAPLSFPSPIILFIADYTLATAFDLDGNLLITAKLTVDGVALNVAGDVDISGDGHLSLQGAFSFYARGLLLHHALLILLRVLGSLYMADEARVTLRLPDATETVPFNFDECVNLAGCACSLSSARYSSWLTLGRTLVADVSDLSLKPLKSYALVQFGCNRYKTTFSRVDTVDATGREPCTELRYETSQVTLDVDDLSCYTAAPVSRGIHVAALSALLALSPLLAFI